MNPCTTPQRAQGGRPVSIRNTALTWLGYCFEVIAGVASGAAVTYICMMVLVGVLYLWAIWAGSILALAIWITAVAVSTVRAHSRGWNSVTVRFLAGFGIIPCFLGIGTIVVVSIDGLGNPFLG